MKQQQLNSMISLLHKGPHTLIDIGASGGLNPRWKPFRSLLCSVGFEPDPAEFSRLNQTPQEIWLDNALSDKKHKKTLYVTRSQTNTSLLKPNYNLLSQFQWSPHEPIRDHEVVKEIEIECDSIDNILLKQKINPDFLKVDTQGTELDILTGSLQTLKDHLLIVESEVEFAPIYEGQPLFADVDSFMRAQGFYLQDLGNFLSMKPRGLAGVGGAKGRLISADVLYFKDFSSDFTKIYEMGEAKVHAAVLGYVAYGYPELAANLLLKLKDKKISIQNSEVLIALLQKIKPNPAIWGSLAKRCGKIWYKYRQPKHCLWDAPLGNDL